jgi:hypothetical protein
MSGRTAATRSNASPLKLLADCAPMNAQLSTDPAKGPALGVQVGRIFQVHRDTVTSLNRIAAPKPIPYGGRWPGQRCQPYSHVPTTPTNCKGVHRLDELEG